MNDQHDNSATDKEMLAKATSEGTDMVVFLVSGDFQVHRKGCKAIYRVRKSGKAGNEFEQQGATKYDTVATLWEDIINENVPHNFPTAHEAITEYHHNTEFHTCLADMPDGGPAEPAQGSGNKETPKPSAKQAAKRELATLVVEAAAKAALEAANAGISGIDDEDIMKIVSHWLHHLPADRERWVAAGLPKPNRSDWR